MKHAALFSALGAHFPQVEPWDIEAAAPARLWWAMQSFRLDRQRWRGRFNAHPAMFDARTAAVARMARDSKGQADAFLQIGVTFDAAKALPGARVVIYTDYLAVLTRSHGREWRQDIPAPAVAARLRQEAAALRGAAHLCTRSRLVADAAIAEYGLAAEKVSVAGGGPNVLPRGPKAEPLRFLFFGSEFRRKGGDLVLGAFRRLVAERPGVQLDFVGSAAHVAGMGGVVCHETPDPEALRDLIGAAGVILMPSRFETWGDALVEAMTGGAVPVIADRAPMTEIVRDGIDGLVMAEDSETALYEAMRVLVLDDALRGRLAASAQARMRDGFRMEDVAARLAQRLRG